MSSTIYICIPVHNRIEYTLKCIESIKKQNYENYDIIICDDGSTDGTTYIISKQYPDIKILDGDGNLWWAGATNKCIKEAIKRADDDDFIYTLNNDTELLHNTLEILVEISKKNPGSIIGAINVFYDEPDRIEPSAFKKKNKYLFKQLPRKVNHWGERLNENTHIVEVDTLSGKGVLIPVELYKKLGLYNCRDLPHYHADIEFTLRAKKNGYKILLSYDARVLSHQHLSGIGTVTSKPTIKEFLKSFFYIKSTHHFKSLSNYCRLLFGKFYIPYFIIMLFGITIGFTKRYFHDKLK